MNLAIILASVLSIGVALHPSGLASAAQEVPGRAGWALCQAYFAWSKGAKATDPGMENLCVWTFQPLDHPAQP